MNWKLTRPDHLVTFEKDEPVCMIVPQRRGELESFRPRVGDIETDPELAASHRCWAESRYDFKIGLRMTPAPNSEDTWQRHYFHGTSPGGPPAPEHQRKLQLRPFHSGKDRPG